jgi:hypothetical protein
MGLIGVVGGHVVVSDPPHDVAAGGDPGLDQEAGAGAHVVEGHDVERIAHGQGEVPVGHRDGQDLMAAGDVHRQQGQGLGVGSDLAQVEGRDVELRRERLHDVLLADHLHGDQDFAEPPTRPLLDGEGFL